MKINYDYEELIDELKKDIEEFGDIEMYAFFNKIEGYIFLTSYDFIIEDAPLIPDEIDESIIQIMKASEILKILEKQNEIF